MKKIPIYKMMNIISAVSLVVIVVFAGYLYKSGVFTNVDSLKKYIMGFGALGAVGFILIQIMQVVIPIFPGGISCIAGVIMFGGLFGFVYNYIGICIGSVIVFFISRIYGKKAMTFFFGTDKIGRYEKWTSNNNRFLKMFAIAIFLPFAPDDMLCYIAGTTNMKFLHYLIIIILGKPVTILLYSFGAEKIFSRILGTLLMLI